MTSVPKNAVFGVGAGATPTSVPITVHDGVQPVQIGILNPTDHSHSPLVKSTGASVTRSLADRFGERLDVISYGADGTASGNSAALRAAVNRAIVLARPCVIDLPPGDFLVNAFDSVVGTNEGICLLLDSTTPKLVIQGHAHGLGTTIKPVSNKVMIFGQAGAGDLSIQDVIFDNSSNGVLQNQVKAIATTAAGGVAQLGNSANVAIQQYYGQNLTVRRCRFNSFNACVVYSGDYRDQTILSGTIILDDIDFENYAFGLLTAQPRVLRMTKIRSRSRVNSYNSGGVTDVDPGHDLYLSNRAGAAPYLILVDDVQSEGTLDPVTGNYVSPGSSSSIKVRKGQLVCIANVMSTGSGRGVEVWNAENVSVANCNVKIVNDTNDANQCAFEFTDCGSLNYSNLRADVRGTLAWGVRIRSGGSPSAFINTNVRGNGVTVVTDHTSFGGGLAPIIISDQTDTELVNARIEHHGTVPNSRYPIDVRNCTRASIVYPSHRTPDGVYDAFRLVSFDATCVNCSVVYRDIDLNTAVTASTISDIGTGTMISRIPAVGTLAALNSDSSFTSKVAGSLAAPALGVTAAGDTLGFYRTGSQRFGLSVIGTEILEFYGDRTVTYKDIFPSADAGANLGRSGFRFKSLSLATLSAAPSVTPYDGQLALSDGTWGGFGAGLYRYDGTATAWVLVGSKSSQFLATGGGSVTSPACGYTSGSDTSGLYSSGTGKASWAINGNQILEVFSDRVLAYKNIFPSTDGAILLGQATNRFLCVALKPLSAKPTSTPYDGQMAMSDGTVTSNGWGAGGAGLYRYNGSTSAWVFVG